MIESSSTIDRIIIARDWHKRGFTCGMWIDHAGREWKLATQDTEELFMALSGELELELDGERFRPSPGKEFHIPSGKSYIIRNVGGTTARWVYGHKRSPSVAHQPTGSAGDMIHSPS